MTDYREYKTGHDEEGSLIGIGIAMACFFLAVAWGALELFWRKVTRR